MNTPTKIVNVTYHRKSGRKACRRKLEWSIPPKVGEESMQAKVRMEHATESRGGKHAGESQNGFYRRKHLALCLQVVIVTSK